MKSALFFLILSVILSGNANAGEKSVKSTEGKCDTAISALSAHVRDFQKTEDEEKLKSSCRLLNNFNFNASAQELNCTVDGSKSISTARLKLICDFVM